MRKPKPSKKGMRLAKWRIILSNGRPIDPSTREECRVCLDDPMWANRCCWACDRLHICLPRWEGKVFPDLNCPFLTKRGKRCFLVMRELKERHLQ